MKWVITLLVALLLGTNAFWFYGAIDTGVTLSYRDKQLYELEETRKQLMAVLPDVAIRATKKEVVEAASRYTDLDAFEKDGCTWVGWIGLKFDEQGQLLSVSPTWSFGEKDPCYPSN